VSRVRPLFKRRPREVGERQPQLSRPGLARGACDLALRGLLGDAAPGSPASLVRLPAPWPVEEESWPPRRREDLAGVSVWADGLDVKAGLEDPKAALLVRSGALPTGQTVVLAGERGPRESQESWGTVLRDLRARGRKPWRGPVADGHLGLWAAVAEQQPTVAEQRCGNPRLTTGLEALPPQHPAPARTRRCALPSAERHAVGEALRAQCVKRDSQRAPKAVERLAAEWERVGTCDPLPRDHGRHLRTTPVVASPCAAVRLRTTAAKRFKTVDSATALLWKMLPVAEGTFRRLKAPELLPAVDAGATSGDGRKQRVVTPQEVAA
jgi:putative transposase